MNVLLILFIIAVCQLYSYFVRHNFSMDDTLIGKLECLTVGIAQLCSVVLFITLFIHFI